MNLSEYIKEHYQKKDGIRLGQRFVNDFIVNQWAELFYETNDERAVWIIEKYLQERHYLNTLPPRNTY